MVTGEWVMNKKEKMKETIKMFFENRIGCSFDYYSKDAEYDTKTLIEWLEL